MQDKAVTFEKSNVDDLRDKLQGLLDHPEVVEKYSEEAQEYICGKYNWDDVVSRTVGVYESFNDK